MKYSDEQLVDLGLSIIKSTHDFERALDEWMDKPEASKTYDNLQLHFNKALIKLQQIRGEDMVNAAQHHANMIRGDVTGISNQYQQSLMADVQQMKSEILDVLQENKENIVPNESINNTTTIDALTKLTQAIQGLEQRVNKVEKGLEQQPFVQKTIQQLDDIPFWKKPNNRFKYCWSCGSNTTHTSAECKRRREGHVETATFENRQSGSVSRIPKRFRNL